MRDAYIAPDRAYVAIPEPGTGMHSIYSILASFPLAYFTGTFVTDLVYLKTAEMMWADFSAWMLLGGLIMGGLAAIVALVNFFTNPLARRLPVAWLHMAGNLVVLLLALWNSFVHSRDAWTSVVPTGVILSGLTVLLMIFTGFLGWFRYRAGAEQ